MPLSHLPDPVHDLVGSGYGKHGTSRDQVEGCIRQGGDEAFTVQSIVQGGVCRLVGWRVPGPFHPAAPVIGASVSGKLRMSVGLPGASRRVLLCLGEAQGAIVQGAKPEMQQVRHVILAQPPG